MFNPFVKLSDEQVMITIVEDGAEKQVPGFLYRCDGVTQMGICRLVWDRAYLAKSCGDRGHKQSFQAGNYTRSAVRRDGKLAATAAVVAQPAASVPTQLELVKAQALALGFRLSKIPQSKINNPEFEIKDPEEGDSELPF